MAKLSWSFESLAWGTKLRRDKTVIRLEGRATSTMGVLEKHDLPEKTAAMRVRALVKRNLTEIGAFRNKDVRD